MLFLIGVAVELKLPGGKAAVTRQYTLLSDILERMGQNAEARVVIEKGAHLRAIGQSTTVLAN